MLLKTCRRSERRRVSRRICVGGVPGRKDPTLHVVEVTIAPLARDDLAVPGHTGGAPLGPVTAVVTGAPLVENTAVLEWEHTPPAGTGGRLEGGDEALLLPEVSLHSL